MTCKELIEFIIDFIEGDLPEEQRDAFQIHLDRCSPCNDYLESYLHTIRAEKAALCDQSSTPVPPMPEALVKAILAARNQPES